MKKKLSLLFITILILLGLGEIFSRWYLTKTDATNKELKIYKKSEILGWELLPNSEVSHGPKDKEGNIPKITINSLGLRGPEISVNKPKNKKRVLVLGDSFTFGMLIDNEKIFPRLLDKKLQGYEVLNFGTIGYGVDQYYLQLREKGLKFSPDIVVIMFFVGNDATELRAHDWIYDANRLRKIIDEYHIVSDDNQLRRKKGSIIQFSYLLTLIKYKLPALVSKLGGIPIIKWRSLLWSNFLPPDHNSGDPFIFMYYEKAKYFLSEIKKLNDQRGIKTLLAIIPADAQVNLKYLSKYPRAPFGEKEFDEARPQKIINEFAKMEGIEVLDLLPYFREQKEDIYFTKKDPHFTEFGHKITAGLILKKLQDF